MQRQLFPRTFLELCSILLTLILTACLGGGDDGTSGTDGGGGAPLPGPVFTQNTGTVILAGRLLAAPYTIDSLGASVRINGAQAATYAAPPAPTPLVYDPASATLSAFELVDLAAQAYAVAGGGAGGLQSALARLQAHPATATARAVDGPIGTRLVVTAKAGDTASFRPVAPDAAARAMSDAERAQQAAETAALWSDHLAGAGGLVVSSSGNVRLVPAGDIADLLAATDQAFALAATARAAALLALYDDQVVVDDLVANWQPRPTSATPTTRSAAISTQQAAAVGPAGCCKTPGSRKAWVYRALSGRDDGPFLRALRGEGYDVSVYEFASQRQPPGSGWIGFQHTSGAGAVYFITHSSPDGISLQSFGNPKDLADAKAAVKAQTDAGQIDWWMDGHGRWWMDATLTGIAAAWHSNDSIVHAASCYSIALADTFGAREFFGYTGVSDGKMAYPHSAKLWGRLSGTDPGDGSLRQATAAFDSGKGYAPTLMMYGTFRNMTAPGWFSPANWDAAADPTGATEAVASGAEKYHVTLFAYRDGSPQDDTVLSPAVVQAHPAAPLPVGQETAVAVRFDAVMDTRVNADLVLDVAGCARRNGTAVWSFSSLVTLPVMSTEPGTATVTVHAASARAPSSIKLDGNQSEATGVTPNGDDYVFTFQCVGSVTPPTPPIPPTPPTPPEPPTPPTPPTPPEPPTPPTPPTPPQLTLTPATLSVGHVMGSTSCPQPVGTLGIGESADGTITWSIAGVPSWLTLGATQGSVSSASAPAQVSVDFNCGVPGRGSYSGVLTLTGSSTLGSAGSKQVTVTVNVE